MDIEQIIDDADAALDDEHRDRQLIVERMLDQLRQLLLDRDTTRRDPGIRTELGAILTDIGEVLASADRDRQLCLERIAGKLETLLYDAGTAALFPQVQDLAAGEWLPARPDGQLRSFGDVGKCPNCGKQSRSYSHGCPNCGHGLPLAPVPGTGPVPPVLRDWRCTSCGCSRSAHLENGCDAPEYECCVPFGYVDPDGSG